MNCKSQAFRTGSPEHIAFTVLHKPMMYECQDSSSMRFVPIYHDAKSCRKSGLKIEDASPAHCRRERWLAKFCTDNSLRFMPLYAALRDPSPSRMSKSCDGLATSTPLPSASKALQPEFFQQEELRNSLLLTKLVVVNSSDSGILIDSPSFADSSFGTPEKPSDLSSEHRRSISILKRSQPDLHALNTPIKCDADASTRTVSRDISSMFKGLVIPEEIEDSSEDEGLVLKSYKPGERRPKRCGPRYPIGPVGSVRPRVLRKPSSKTSTTSKTSSIKRNASSSAASSPGMQLWDDNNNQIPEDSSSIIPSSKSASKIRQKCRSKTSTDNHFCTFCKNNNETDDFMRSHALKIWEPSSQAFRLTCPVLRNYVCPRCGATGDSAHTFTYCPELVKEVGYRPMSLMAKFKNTVHDSSGRKRMQSALQFRDQHVLIHDLKNCIDVSQ